MIMDLRQYTLKSRAELEEIRQRVGHTKFDKFRDEANKIFRSLEPGQDFYIEQKVSTNNWPAFMKIACLYILDTGRNCNIDIVGDDSNIIRGITSYNMWQAEQEEIKRRLSHFRNRL